MDFEYEIQELFERWLMEEYPELSKDKLIEKSENDDDAYDRFVEELEEKL